MGLFARREENSRRRNNFFRGFTGRNFGPCGAQVDKVLEMAGKKCNLGPFALSRIITIVRSW